MTRRQESGSTRVCGSPRARAAFWLLAAVLTLLSLPRGVRAGDLYVYVQNHTGGSISNRLVTLTATKPVPRAYGTNLIVNDPQSIYSDTTGLAKLTNVMWGNYRVDIAGAPSTSFPLQLPSTNGIMLAPYFIDPLGADFISQLVADGRYAPIGTNFYTTPPFGYVLTSDGLGNFWWAYPASSGGGGGGAVVATTNGSGLTLVTNIVGTNIVVTGIIQTNLFDLAGTGSAKASSATNMLWASLTNGASLGQVATYISGGVGWSNSTSGGAAITTIPGAGITLATNGAVTATADTNVLMRTHWPSGTNVQVFADTVTPFSGSLVVTSIANNTTTYNVANYTAGPYSAAVDHYENIQGKGMDIGVWSQAFNTTYGGFATIDLFDVPYTTGGAQAFGPGFQINVGGKYAGDSGFQDRPLVQISATNDTFSLKRLVANTGQGTPTDFLYDGIAGLSVFSGALVASNTASVFAGTITNAGGVYTAAGRLKSGSTGNDFIVAGPQSGAQWHSGAGTIYWPNGTTDGSASGTIFAYSQGDLYFMNGGQFANTNGLVTITNQGSTIAAQSITAQAYLNWTNLFSGRLFPIGTNYQIITPTNLLFTGVANVPAGTASASGELVALATGGNITITNPISWYCNDGYTNRTLTNGNIGVMAMEVIPGVATNFAFVQFAATGQGMGQGSGGGGGVTPTFNVNQFSSGSGADGTNIVSNVALTNANLHGTFTQTNATTGSHVDMTQGGIVATNAQTGQTARMTNGVITLGTGASATITATGSSGDITATTFTGSGANLTSLNGSAVSGGSINDARLSANVALYNSTGYFSAQQNLTNQNNVVAGSFTNKAGVNIAGAMLQTDANGGVTPSLNASALTNTIFAAAPGGGTAVSLTGSNVKYIALMGPCPGGTGGAASEVNGHNLTGFYAPFTVTNLAVFVGGSVLSSTTNIVFRIYTNGVLNTTLGNQLTVTGNGSSSYVNSDLTGSIAMLAGNVTNTMSLQISNVTASNLTLNFGCSVQVIK